MRPSLRVCSARIHTPLIHFIGKRQWPAKPQPPHAHPAGPPEYKAHFPDFLKRFQLSGSRPAAPSRADNNEHSVYHEFWQAPARLWNTRSRKLSEEEMEAILSGGASLR